MPVFTRNAHEQTMDLFRSLQRGDLDARRCSQLGPRRRCSRLGPTGSGRRGGTASPCSRLCLATGLLELERCSVCLGAGRVRRAPPLFTRHGCPEPGSGMATAGSGKLVTGGGKGFALGEMPSYESDREPPCQEYSIASRRRDPTLAIPRNYHGQRRSQKAAVGGIPPRCGGVLRAGDRHHSRLRVERRPTFRGAGCDGRRVFGRLRPLPAALFFYRCADAAGPPRYDDIGHGWHPDQRLAALRGYRRSDLGVQFVGGSRARHRGVVDRAAMVDRTRDCRRVPGRAVLCLAARCARRPGAARFSSS
jgi:hypothetical protein